MTRRSYSNLVHSVRSAVGRQLAKFRATVAGPYVQAFLVDSYNGRLLVPRGDLQIGRALAFGGHWERETIGFLASYLNPTSEVLFVGAHVGSLLIPIARRVKWVVGLEPNPATFELLKINLKINDIANAECFDFAAGERDGAAEFLTSDYNSGTSKVRRGEVEKLSYNVGRYRSIEVRTRRLDDAFAGRHFDLIVMDVEGSESAALAGMPTLLRSARFLSLEVQADHISHLANQSAEEFFKPVSQVFNRAVLCGEPSGKQFRAEEFPTLLERAGTGFKDVFFYRSQSA